jgi:hypothetical protein
MLYAPSSLQIKSGAEAPLENSHELNQPHPQNSLSLLITYLRREAIANACGRQVYATAAGEPIGVKSSLHSNLSGRQPFFVVLCNSVKNLKVTM